MILVMHHSLVEKRNFSTYFNILIITLQLLGKWEGKGLFQPEQFHNSKSLDMLVLSLSSSKYHKIPSAIHLKENILSILRLVSDWP